MPSVAGWSGVSSSGDQHVARRRTNVGRASQHIINPISVKPGPGDAVKTAHEKRQRTHETKEVVLSQELRILSRVTINSL